jgi:hypothetical protein
VAQALSFPGAGQIQAINAAFDYDTANRLTWAQEGTTGMATCVNGQAGWCEGYGYDQFGNRALVASGHEMTAPVTAVTSFTASTNRNGGPGWTYDTNGNVTVDPAGSGFVYDSENRLAVACVATNCFGYGDDGNGRRVKRVYQNGTADVYAYDAAGQLAAEYLANSVGQSNVLCLTADQLGSTRVISQEGAVVVERRDYTPFGEEIVAAGSDPRTLAPEYAVEQGISQKIGV